MTSSSTQTCNPEPTLNDGPGAATTPCDTGRLAVAAAPCEDDAAGCDSAGCIAFACGAEPAAAVPVPAAATPPASAADDTTAAPAPPPALAFVSAAALDLHPVVRLLEPPVLLLYSDVDLPRTER